MKTLSQDDVSFEAMRSGGPGGQHGDRRATAVRLRVAIEVLPLNDTEEAYVREHLPPKNRTGDGELIVRVGEHRSQAQNKKAALKYACDEIEEAIRTGKQAAEKEKHEQRAESNSGGGGGSGDDEDKQKRQRRRKDTDDYLREAYEQDPETIEPFMD